MRFMHIPAAASRFKFQEYRSLAVRLIQLLSRSYEMLFITRILNHSGINQAASWDQTFTTLQNHFKSLYMTNTIFTLSTGVTWVSLCIAGTRRRNASRGARHILVSYRYVNWILVVVTTSGRQELQYAEIYLVGNVLFIWVDLHLDVTCLT